jgi:hypothetical protein
LGSGIRVMASCSSSNRLRRTKLSLDGSGVEILWRDKPEDAALAQLLLRLIGEDGLRQAMEGETPQQCTGADQLPKCGCKKR